MSVRNVDTAAWRRPLLAVGVCLLGLLVGGGLSIAAGFALRALVGGLPILLLVVLSLVLTQGIAFGGVALLYLRYRGLGAEFVPVRTPSVSELGWIVGGYVLAFAAVGVGVAIVITAGLEPASNQIGEIGARDPTVLLALIPLSFLLIGPGEELLFRGVVQGTFREILRPVPAIVLASAVFAAVHFVALTGSAQGRLVTIAVLFLPSLVFGTAYERTDNIVVPAVIHGAYNATLFAMAYLAFQMGSPPTGAVLGTIPTLGTLFG
ncbi:MAG: lysostaphin resistance A-like protein [Halobacteriales archaeon]